MAIFSFSLSAPQHSSDLINLAAMGMTKNLRTSSRGEDENTSTVVIVVVVFIQYSFSPSYCVKPLMYSDTI